MLKTPWHHFYPKYPLIQTISSCKTSLLVRPEILGLFGKTLISDHLYSCHYLREISALRSSAILSKAENIFWNFYWIFAIYTKVCGFWKKDQLHSLKISEVIHCGKCGYLNARKLLFSNTLRESTCSRVLNSAENTMVVLLS